MLERIAVKNFKSLKDIDVEISNLNIFSGVNGSGKSSLIQVLLMIKSIKRKKNYSSAKGVRDLVALNNEDIELGQVEDVLYEGGGDNISIRVDGFGQSHFFTLESDNKSQDYFTFSVEAKDIPERVSRPPLPFAPTVGKIILDLNYLKSERVGPKITQNRNSIEVDHGFIGVSGEFSYEYISQFGDSKIEEIENRKHPDSVNNTLNNQIKYWLREICPSIKFESKYIDNTNLTTSSFILESQVGDSRRHKPTNMGFGVSYVLPVILLCLKAKPGDLIIIDTPEAHLHPKGQSKIGELLSRTAADGVQVIVETHSDHIINGIRLSVLDNIIKPEETNFIFFKLVQKDEDLTYSTEVSKPYLNNLGQFDNWPDGFFDQWNSSVKKILTKQFKNDR
ncbi:DUF3696 domain-containing protein [Acinetobacter baumannii]|nr:DUF3696 domain-containing protein [Acinetobacter baumannii]EMC7949341.1 DUF3696 domain-containing protein [Acinetobacter baumannii]EMD9691600.1 DUF3696 domain-containing protein [Acinetobacter baumannii]